MMYNKICSSHWVNALKWNYYLITVSMLFSGCGTSVFEKDFIFPSPVAQQAQQISSVDFVAQWNQVTGATGYEVDVATDERFTEFVVNYRSISVTELSLKVINLDANTDYYYRVRAKISNQTSPSSNIIKVTTANLNTPVVYPATEVTANSFRLHWKKQPTATAYLLDVGLDANFTTIWSDFQGKEIEQDTTLLLNDLTVNQQYFYRIRTKQNNTLSEYSNIQSVFTSTLAAPQKLTITDVQFTSFRIEWENVGEADSYQLDVATDPLFRDILPAYNAIVVNNTNQTVVGLEANQVYYCRLRSVNGSEISNHSEVVQTQTLNLATPVALPASNVQIGGFTAHWQSVPSAALYLIEIATNADFSRIVLNLDNVVGTEVSVTGLEANTQYYYRVQAQGLGTTSDHSNVISVTTQALGAPVATLATNQDVFGFTVNWLASADASSYELDIALDAGFTTFFPGYQARAVTGTFLNVTGIDFRQTYYYRLRAKRLSSESANSNVIQVEGCIGQSCKVTKIEIFASGSTTPEAYSQTYTYDSQNRLVTITNGTDRYLVTYNADNTIQKVELEGLASFIYRRYEYTYSGNQLQTVHQYGVTRSGVASFQRIWVFAYNAQGQRSSWNTYRDLAQTDRHLTFNYFYGTGEEVVSVSNNRNRIIKLYGYDDQISLYSTFNPDLAFFICNSTNDTQRGILPNHNMTFEQLGLTTYNYSFQYNSKGIATQQMGDYIVKFTVEGCDF